MPGFLLPRYESKSVSDSEIVRRYCHILGFVECFEPRAACLVYTMLSQGLPPGWSCSLTDEAFEFGPGIPFFYEFSSRKSQWTHPSEGLYLSDIVEALQNAPTESSRIFNLWCLCQSGISILDETTDSWKRPVITDDSSLSMQGYVPVNMRNGFPVISVHVIQSFASYYGMPPERIHDSLGILAAAAFCPLPSEWQFRISNGVPAFTKRDGSCCSLHHPFDEFFHHLIEALQRRSTDSDRGEKGVALIDLVDSSYLYDWSLNKELQMDELFSALELALTPYNRNPDGPTTWNEMKAIMEFREIAFEQAQLDIPSEVLQEIERVCRIPRVFAVHDCLLEVLGELVHNICANGTRDRLDRTITAAHGMLQSETLRFERMLRGPIIGWANKVHLRGIMNAMRIIARISISSRLELYQDRVTLWITAFVVIWVTRCSGMKGEEHREIHIDRLSDAFDAVENLTGSPSVASNREVRQRLIRLSSGDDIVDYILSRLTDLSDSRRMQFMKDVIDEADALLSIGVISSVAGEHLEGLVSVYIPGASVVTTGVLRQLSIKHLGLVEGVLNDLIIGLNSSLLRSLSERDRIHGELSTKESTLQLFL